MEYINISRIVTLVASIVITVGLYDQAVKIWRTKSAKDFSGIIILAIVFNEMAWLNYGIALREWPIILLAIMNVPAAFVAAIGFIKYHKEVDR